MLKKSFWALADQALNSFSSLILAVMVARESSPSEVGAWAIGYSIYTIVLTVSRSAISTTAIISSGSNARLDAADQIQADRDAVSAAVIGAFSIGLIVAPLGLLLGNIVGFYVFLFGISLPLLIWQDAMRFVAIRRGLIHWTVVIDAVWLFLQIVIALALLSRVQDGRVVTVGWLLASAVSTIVAMCFVSPRIGPNAGLRFFKAHRRTIGALFTESMLGAGVANLLPALLGVVIGLSSTGYFRGAMTLIGVASAVIMGLAPIMTVEASRRFNNQLPVTLLLWGWIGVISSLGVALTLISLSLPDSIGETLLGESWLGAAAILPILAAQVVLRGPNEGILIVLRAARQLKLVVGIRIVHSTIALIVTTCCASLFGLYGAAWGWLASSILLCLYTSAFYLNYLRKTAGRSL